MEYKYRNTMPKWKASLISGVVIVAGFYASADLEKRNNKLVQRNVTLRTTKQNHAVFGDSGIKVADSVVANKGSIISKR